MLKSISSLFLITIYLFLNTENKLIANEQFNLFNDLKAFEIKDTTGKVYSNSDLKSETGTLIIFLSNHCKVSQKFQKPLISINKKWMDNGIKLFVISPNIEKAILPDELAYSEVGDSMDGMKERARLQNYNFPYLYDGDNQTITSALNAKITPTAFLFNSKGEMKYVGKVGNHKSPNSIEEYELNQSINDLINGNTKFVRTKTYGTAIKFPKDLKLAEDVQNRYSREKVLLNYANERKLNFYLRQNTNYPRFFYIWSLQDDNKITRENLLKISTSFKIFRKRGLKVYTICVCEENEKEQAHEILKRAQLSSLNFYTLGEEVSEISNLRSASGFSTTPFCRLISGSGIFDYGKNGEIEIKELRKSILNILEDEN